MELIIIAVLAVLIPICAIAAFIVGYNVNAPKKIATPPKKRKKPTKEQIELEETLDFIENAQVYKTEG